MYSASVTERESFDRCKRKWFYSHKIRLARIVPEIHFMLGSMMHQAHATWLLQPEANFEEIFNAEASRYVLDIELRHKAVQASRLLPDIDFTPIYDQVELGKAMARNYQLKWHKPLPGNMTLLTPEQEISINVYDDLYLKGKIDALIQDSHGRIYVLEHKTWGKHPNINDLNQNDQFLAYIYMATKLNVGEVVGIAYDGLWKRADVPKGKNLDDLFERRILRRNIHELQEFEEMLILQIREMKLKTRELEFYGQLGIYSPPPISYRKTVPYDGCSDCSFRELCHQQSVSGDTENQINTFYYQREG